MKKLKIIIAISLVVLLSSCGVRVSTQTANKALKNTPGSSANVDVNSTSIASIDIENISKQLETLEKELAHDDSEDAILKHLNEFKEKSGLNILSVFFGDEGGNFYIAPITELPADYDAKTRLWYRSAKENGEYVSDAYVDSLTNNKMLTIGKAIYRDNDLIGVVAIDLVIEIIN